MTSVVVVGGGMIGTTVASACARRGARVCLVERDELAGGASALDLALIPSEIDIGPFLDLHHFTGGAFFLDRSPPDSWPARRMAGRAAVAALAHEARSHGADIRTCVDVKALLVRSGRVRGVLTDAGEIAGEKVVLATGIDAWRLLAPHAIDPGGEIDAGEVVAVRPHEAPGGPALVDDAWIAPDEAGLVHVARPIRAAALVPGLSELPVAARRNLRAAAGAAGPPDGLDGVYLARAPDGWGIARAPSLAADVARWVADG